MLSLACYLPRRRDPGFEGNDTISSETHAVMCTESSGNSVKRQMPILLSLGRDWRLSVFPASCWSVDHTLSSNVHGAKTQPRAVHNARGKGLILLHFIPQNETGVQQSVCETGQYTEPNKALHFSWHNLAVPWE